MKLEVVIEKIKCVMIRSPCLPISNVDPLPFPTQATDTDIADTANCPLTMVTDNPGTSDQVSNLTASPNLVHNHRHMNYCDTRARHETFQNWQHHATQDPVCMVECGYFYTGKGDLVRCYSCGIGLKDWGEGDDPLLEHIKHSKNCKHIALHLDSTIEQYKSRVCDKKFAAAGTTGKQNLDYQQADARKASFTRWLEHAPSAEEVAAAGFYYTGFQDQVKCFHCGGVLRSWDPIDDPWVEHARWFPDCGFLKCTKGDRFIQNNQAAVQKLDPEVTHHDTSTLRLYDPVDSSDESVLKTHKELMHCMKCIQCEDKDANVVFLPCCHHRMCSECAGDVSMCPICGLTVKEQIKTQRA